MPDRPEPPAPRAATPARSRDDLLDAVLEYVAEHGAGGFSLRACAEAIGTSHRMLAYHFGSREGLLEAVADEAMLRARLANEMLLASRPTSRRVVADLVDAALADHEAEVVNRLVVEAAYLRLHAGVGESVEEWRAAWEPMLVRQLGEGLSPEQARTRARLALAVQLGLAYDLAASGDRQGVAAAYRDWYDLAPALDDRAVQRAVRVRPRPAW